MGVPDPRCDRRGGWLRRASQPGGRLGWPWAEGGGAGLSIPLGANGGGADQEALAGQLYAETLIPLFRC